MSEIIVEFTPTPEDYKKSSLSFSSKNFWMWALSGWLGIPVIILVIISWVTSRGTPINFGGSIIALVIGYVLTMYPYAASANSMRQALRDKKLCLPVKYIFSETEIIMMSSEYELKYKWEGLAKIGESNLFYYLVQNGMQSFQFIPKRAFKNTDMENEFRDLIFAHFENIEVFEKGLSGWKLALVSSIVSLIVNYGVLITTSGN